MKEKKYIYNYLFEKGIYDRHSKNFIVPAKKFYSVYIDYNLIVETLNNKLFSKDNKRYNIMNQIQSEKAYSRILSRIDYLNIIYYFDNFNIYKNEILLENLQLPIYIVKEYLRDINWNFNIFLKQNLNFDFILDNIEIFNRFFKKENLEILKQNYTEEELKQLLLLTLL